MPIPFLGGGVNPSPKEHYGRKSTFLETNGYTVPKPTETSTAAPDVDATELAMTTLRMTYGERLSTENKKEETKAFCPDFVKLDKQVLFFKAYMQQTVHESATERYRVRYFNMYYYLEDDTVTISEPEIENSGMPHGPFVKRCKLDGIHWTTLNVGANITVNSKVLRLYETNSSTAKFLESEGILVGKTEEPPKDPYTETRKTKDHPNIIHDTPSEFDKFKQFLVLDRKVLRFKATWEDPNEPGHRLKAQVYYYLVDDTVEICEVHEKNDGRDPFPILLGRTKVPRNYRAVPLDFPSAVLELSDAETQDFVSPADFAIGKDVGIFGRVFFIYDMDEFTKTFYRRNFDVQDFTPVEVDEPAPPKQEPEIPPYTGIGSPEDSYLSCVMIDPKAPAGQKSLLQLLKHDNMVLRFVSKLDPAKHPDNEGRTFILSFRLADDYVSIFEPPVKNSGIQGGTILSYQLVKSPGCNPDLPSYLKPTDFYVGATVEIFAHHYIISGCDRAVLNFMEANPAGYAAGALEATRATFDA